MKQRSSSDSVALVRRRLALFIWTLLVLAWTTDAYFLVKSQPNCAEPKTVEAREEDANVIISGYVSQVYREPFTLNYACSVKVIRVFKGDNDLPNTLETMLPIGNEDVMVAGFGAEKICDNAVSTGDTRIFMLKREGDQLLLNSSVIRITVNNLERTEAAVENKHFATRKPLEQSPCDLAFCAFGAVCQETADGKANCVCSTSCSTVFTPVCGTDEVTYTNECLLQVASCQQKRRIKVGSQGPCGTAGGPCADKVCDYGAHCEPSADGLSATCLCPGNCETQGSSSQMVCGTDGNTYSSECAMYKIGCEEKRDIHVKYHGLCDPCMGVQCDGGRVCQVDQDRKASCQCPDNCDGEPQQLLCANDTQTYTSYCQLRRAECLTGRPLAVLVASPCEEVLSLLQLCQPTTCPLQGSYCSLASPSAQQPECLCATECPPLYRPVCASDGLTYDSECSLNATACIRQESIQIKAQGTCGTLRPTSCEDYECSFGGRCVMENEQPTCECLQACPLDYSPVCGSDGQTHPNYCALEGASCQQQKEITVISQGPCNDCELVDCPFYGICEANSVDGAKCVCPNMCVDNYMPVCGSDGTTYTNECELRVAACQSQKFITVTSKRPCDSCDEIECDFGAQCENGVCGCPEFCPEIYRPVCASDGNTYGNECEMQMAGCQMNRILEVVEEGECEEASGSGDYSGGGELGCDDFLCDFGGRCVESQDGKPSCDCSFNCPAIRLQVCGSDGVTYGNECQMKETSCRRNREISIDKKGPCDEEVEEEACDGETPLINPDNGDDYYCGEGEGHSDCPAGSYCHIHSAGNFALCCAEQDGSQPCEETVFGCCPDDKTAALGINGAGCPSTCECNQFGSYSTTCDPQSRQCSCKPGVGGTKCDRCEPGFWDYRGLITGNSGCRPCGCSKGGSVRDDCDQMNGMCVCKNDAFGLKCDMCKAGQVMGPTGCKDVDEPTKETGETCEELQCSYGASCQLLDNLAQCTCPSSCQTSSKPVCGSNGQTYGSECQLVVLACRYQQHIAVAYPGPCQPTPLNATITTTTKPGSTTTTSAAPVTTTTTVKVVTTTTPATTMGTTARDLTTVGQTTSGQSTMGPTTMDRRTTVDEITTRAETTMKEITTMTTTTVTKLGPTTPLPPDCSTEEFGCCPDGVTEAEGPNGEGCDIRPPTNITCADSPCLHGGSCLERPGLPAFRCRCPLGKGGPVCEDDISFQIPEFSGPGSYLALPRMTGSATRTNIEIDFLTTEPQGLLLFTSQEANGGGDFIWLVISDGYISVSYDLGSGKANVVSEVKVDDGSWHNVKVLRDKQKVTLKVDDHPEVAGKSPGGLSGLNNEQMVYLGGFTRNDRITIDLPVEPQLRGCIRLLTLNNIEYALDSQSVQLVSGAQVGECGEDPCSEKPCQHGGVCVAEDAESFYCECAYPYMGIVCGDVMPNCEGHMCAKGSTCQPLPEGGYQCICDFPMQGLFCNESIEGDFIPAFGGKSYIELPGLNDRFATQLALEVTFYPSSSKGVIFYNGQNTDGTGDFISLIMLDEYLELRYNLGSGPAVIRSNQKLPLENWYLAEVERNGKQGTMIITGIDNDYNDVIEGESQGNLGQLNLKTGLFLGGVDDYNKVADYSSVTDGLVGAIKSLLIKESPDSDPVTSLDPQALVDNDNALNVVDVSNFLGHPCSDQPCINGALCVPEGDDFTCNCAPGFTGVICETEINLDAPIKLSFDSDESFYYHNTGTADSNNRDIRSNQISMAFRTTQSEGLLLSSETQVGPIVDDFLLVSVVGGNVQLSYNLGSGAATITSDVRVDDGQWHVLNIDRENESGSLSVDEGSPVSDSTKPGTSSLNTDGFFWIGKFEGCIRDLELNGNVIHLYHDAIGDDDANKPSQFCDQ